MGEYVSEQERQGQFGSAFFVCFLRKSSTPRSTFHCRVVGVTHDEYFLNSIYRYFPITNSMIFLAVYSATSASPATGRKLVALEGKRQVTDAGNSSSGRLKI